MEKIFPWHNFNISPCILAKAGKKSTTWDPVMFGGQVGFQT